MTDHKDIAVSTERLEGIAEACRTWVKSGNSGAPDLDRDIASAISELISRRSTDGDPVAWLHTLHMELEQKEVRVTRSSKDPFGERGKSYDPTYLCISEPLYTRPAPKP